MISVIPMPETVIEKEGLAIFAGKIEVYFDKSFKDVREHFFRCFSKAIEGGIAEAKKEDKAVIKFIKEDNLADEEYKLDITALGIIAKASSDKGANYAFVTLCQLLHIYELEGAEKIEAPIVSIIDKPRYKWRGLLLDVSRHFFGMDDVKKIMDNMFLHKLNVLHLHLTDDQGWRIEIKRYPLLTEIGSKRKWTQIHGWPNVDPEKDIEKVEHSGYYTQDDIVELVEYARARNIMVVPEIDMPAHFRAAMAGYPFLQCDESVTRPVPWYFGANFATLEGDANDVKIIACAGKESTYDFIAEVIDEVAPLFPAPYFHIGGDEAPKDEWKKCPHCQEKMKAEGIESEAELQDYFNNRVVEMLKEHGKRLIVWNEALEGGKLDNSTIGQYWTPTRDKNAELYANKKGGSLILSKHSSFYFDMCYGQVPLQSTYNFDAKNIGIEEGADVLGVEEAEETTEL